MDEATLVQETLRGNINAFGMLAGGYQRALVASARYLTGSADDAEDLAQEALLKAYQGISSLHDPAKFRAWVFAILRRLCYTHLQRHSDSTASLDDIAETLPAPEVPDELYAASLLDRLPLAYREVLVTHYMMGLSYEEIAVAQETTLETVQMRAFRARAMLKTLLRAEEEEERRILTMAISAVPLSPGMAFTDRVLVEVKGMNVQTAALSNHLTASGVHGVAGNSILSALGVKIAGVILLALLVPSLYLALRSKGAGEQRIKPAIALTLPFNITQPVTGNTPVEVKFPVNQPGQRY